MKNEPVILIPGTESSAEVSFSGLQPLLARDFDVRLFDFQSHGEKAEDFFEGYIDQLVTLIDESDVSPVHLFGYSLGAHIAMHAAARSDKVASLCLVAGWLKTDTFQRERHDLWLRLYDKDPDLAGRISHLTQYAPSYRSFLAEQQTATTLKHFVPDEEVRKRVEANRTLDSTTEASLIDIPTLIISGTSDFKVPMHSTLELYGSIKESTLLKTTAGHALLRERLGQVYGGYHDFLQGVMEPGIVLDTLVP